MNLNVQYPLDRIEKTWKLESNLEMCHVKDVPVPLYIWEESQPTTVAGFAISICHIKLSTNVVLRFCMFHKLELEWHDQEPNFILFPWLTRKFEGTCSIINFNDPTSQLPSAIAKAWATHRKTQSARSGPDGSLTFLKWKGHSLPSALRCLGLPSQSRSIRVCDATLNL